MSDSVSQTLIRAIGLGLIRLLAMFVQLIGGFFAPGVFGGSGLELIIAGFGTSHDRCNVICRFLYNAKKT